MNRPKQLCFLRCYRQEAERLPFVGDLEPILALQQGRCCMAKWLASQAYAQLFAYFLVNIPVICLVKTVRCVSSAVIRYNLHPSYRLNFCQHMLANALPAAEYQAGSAVFITKIKSLEVMYNSIRRARGDGNCFFRSFVFAYMEHLVHRADLTERNRCELVCILKLHLLLLRPTTALALHLLPCCSMQAVSDLLFVLLLENFTNHGTMLYLVV